MDSYPDINDPDFQFLIARRLEFRNLENIDGLYPHQEFVRRFMSPYTPYKSLIVYHSLGSGKSIACIAVAVDHYLHDGKKCIIVTKGDTGTENFLKQIWMYHEMCSSKNKWNMSMFFMRHYISLSNQINSMSDEDVIDAFSNSILILDEVHNVRYLKRAIERSVYGSIIRLLKLCTNVKLIIATATPMTDSPEQIYSILGMCNYSRNEKLSMNGIISYNSAICDIPSSSHVGTFEYVPEMCVYPSYMQGHQEQKYMREYKKQPPDDIYRKLTHISLFCFNDRTYGREVTNTKMSKTRMKTMITSMSTKQTKEIKYIKYSIMQQFAHMLSGKNLQNSSSKYAAVVDLIEKSDGNIFIFLEEVKGSGLLLLASVLEQHGYELYLGEDLDNMSHGKRYTMCVGSSEICPNNNDRLDGFNSDLNKSGEYVKILLGSKVIGESITLKNVRHFYCLTPHWNDSTVDQAIGRVVRNGSHLALDEEYRHVDIYIHVSIFKDKPYDSVDLKKLERCKEKEAKIKAVEEMMIDCAVDKYINDQFVPITYFANFAAAYLHNHEEKIFALISEYCKDSSQYDITEMANALNINITVFKEALCKMISSNIPIQHTISYNPRVSLDATRPSHDFFSKGKEQLSGKSFGMKSCNRFIRAYENTIYTVDDPSLPYVMMPDAMYTDTIVSTRCNPRKSKNMTYERVDLNTFRYMPVKRKIMYIEQCISQGRYEDLSHIETVYANIDGLICHLLMYRDVESSYSSSIHVPKKPMAKTRVFADGMWKNVESIEKEQHIFNRYRLLVTELLNKADEMYPIYGLISTIDGDMRLRLRKIENHEKSSNDTRYVKRGRNMKSIKKAVLLDILFSIYRQQSTIISTSDSGDIGIVDFNVHEHITITEAAKRIDEALVNTKLYIVL